MTDTATKPDFEALAQTAKEAIGTEIQNWLDGMLTDDELRMRFLAVADQFLKAASQP